MGRLSDYVWKNNWRWTVQDTIESQGFEEGDHIDVLTRQTGGKKQYDMLLSYNKIY